jgi:cytochrome c553
MTARLLSGGRRFDAATGDSPHGTNDRSRSPRASALLILPLVIAVPLVLAACGPKKEAGPPPADIAAGKALAEAQCVGCHSLDGKGEAPGIPTLAAQNEQYLVDSLEAYKDGKRIHAALHDLTAGLSDADMRNVAGYFASLPPVKATASAPVVEVMSPYEKGKAASVACARCHGEDGNSTTPGIPSLAGQQPRYFVSAVRAYLDGRRNIMGKEMLRELSHVDIESLALFFASQTPARREAPSFGDPAKGEPLSARCGGCHGANGVSHISTTPTLAGQDPQYLVGAIKAYRDQTRQHSIMLDNNTDAEIEDLAAFYAIQESQPAVRTPLTVAALTERCDRCHGADAEPSTLVVPKIDGQDFAYLVNALSAYRDGARESSMMHNMSVPYSDALIESVASLYASRKPR